MARLRNRAPQLIDDLVSRLPFDHEKNHEALHYLLANDARFHLIDRLVSFHEED